MKLTRVTLGFAALAAVSLFLGCDKKTPNTPPEPDTEVTTAVDAAWATYVITDIEMMCAFAGVDEKLRHFYTPIPGTEGSLGPTTGTMQAVYDIDEERISMVFNKTQCIDGRLRDGEVRLSFSPDIGLHPNANANALYIDRYGFAGRLTLTNYYVDGWHVETPEPAYLYNWLPANDYNPEETNITWELVGKFHFTHPTNPDSNMVWEGNLNKILLNTSDEEVFTKGADHAITWQLAKVGYYGEFKGFTNATVPYTMSIKESQMLIRDFTCTPDRIAGVTLTPADTLALRVEEHHPFIEGVATFKTGDAYPRQIYFGNEGNTSLQPQCDNVGEVMIKGIAYRVNFRK